MKNLNTQHPVHFCTLSKFMLVLHIYLSRLQAAISEPHILALCYAKNLRGRPVRAELVPSPEHNPSGNSPCNTRRCLTCIYIRAVGTFNSFITNQMFTVHTLAKYTTTKYLIQCWKCGKQYVGETQKPYTYASMAINQTSEQRSLTSQ